MIPPGKQTRSSFMFFSRFIRPLLKLHDECDKPQTISKPLSVMWNSLNFHQKTPFNILSKEDVERTREERLLNHDINSFISQKPIFTHI